MGETSPERLDRIKKLFKQKYEVEPGFYGRAPGRVNIIGEHIDYCGYAVFPMALEQDITIAVAVTDDSKYRMSNTNDFFEDFECDVKDFKIDGHTWHDYMLCGHRGVLDACSVDSPSGMRMLVDGTVPKGAGLSSSSALVCCSAIVTAAANNKQVDKYKMADICTKCERYVGVEGGGMDQSISLLAEPGTAKLIEFHPIRGTAVQLPDDVTFVVANSLREMNKGENAGDYYNLRVVECRLAAQILAKKGGHDWRSTRILSDTQEAYNCSLDQMVNLVDTHLHKHPYTRDEVLKILEITDAELSNKHLNDGTREKSAFSLHQRARHVYSEAARVLEFKRVCEAERTETTSSTLGDLMNASQKSCAEDYECSCEELDELTEVCREAGALGSRLTGAGWGGCTVSLVPNEKVDAFIAAVRSKYYEGHPTRVKHIGEAIFATKPGGGAAIIQVK